MLIYSQLYKKNKLIRTQDLEMHLNENIFREYDIRGVVLEDFQNDVVESLGKAFGTYIVKKGWKSISVSGDIRETSLELKETFINGFVAV